MAFATLVAAWSLALALSACAATPPPISPSSAEATPRPEWRRVSFGATGVSVETPGPSMPQTLLPSATLVLVQEMPGGIHAEARVGEEEKPEGWTYYADTAARRDALGRDVSAHVTGPIASSLCGGTAQTYTVERPDAIVEAYAPLEHVQTPASTTVVTVFRAGTRGVTLIWRVPTARRAQVADAERRFLQSVRCDAAPPRP